MGFPCVTRMFECHPEKHQELQIADIPNRDLPLSWSVLLTSNIFMFSLGGSFFRLLVQPLPLGRSGSSKFHFLKLNVTNYSPSEGQLQVPSNFSVSKRLLYKTQKSWRKVPITYFKNGTNKYLLILKLHVSAQIILLSFEEFEKPLTNLNAITEWERAEKTWLALLREVCEGFIPQHLQQSPQEVCGHLGSVVLHCSFSRLNVYSV